MPSRRFAIALLLIGLAALSARAENEPRILITRVPSRKGIAYRWWIGGKLVASAMEKKTGPGSSEMVNIKGDIPAEPAAELDSKGRVAADWIACDAGGKNFYITAVKTYFETGELKLEEPGLDRNCEQTGVHRQYYRSGKINWESEIRQGALNGHSVEYREDGKTKKKEGSYADNERDGPWYSYSEDGTRIIEITTYRAGKMVKRSPLGR